MTTLLVAAGGGHLNELVQLAPRLAPADDDVVWVTDDTLQSRSVLCGARVAFMAEISSRDLLGVAAAVPRAWSVLRRHRPDRVVSTGSAIAAAFLPLARARGIDCHYIESGTRVLGPSVTGRLLERVPGIRCYTQHQHWASGRWAYAGSVLDGFRAELLPAPPQLRRVVVTLGTWEQPFRRLVERLVPLLPPAAEVLWQTGHTDVTGLVDRPRRWVPATELSAALREADLVVTHAGMGATLDALAAGRCPVVMARRAAFDEQVDDHQLQLAGELSRRGLAIVREPEVLTHTDLLAAAAMLVTRVGRPSSFALTPADAATAPGR